MKYVRTIRPEPFEELMKSQREWTYLFVGGVVFGYIVTTLTWVILLYFSSL